MEKEIDAIEGETFEVTTLEVETIKSKLYAEFPSSEFYLSEAYIRSVASKRWSTDPTKRRPISYSTEKLRAVLLWRESSGANTYKQILDISRLNITDMKTRTKKTANIKSEEQLLSQAVGLAQSLNKNSTYIHGYTKLGFPILWIRLDRKSYFVNDVDSEILHHIAMTELLIESMPSQTSRFVIIVDSTSPPPPAFTFLQKMLTTFVQGYPDRLDKIYCAPAGMIIGNIVNFFLPLLPPSLNDKINVFNTIDDVVSHLTSNILLNGVDDIPTFFDGKNNHDDYYPKEGFGRLCNMETLGDGVLMFDLQGMVDRQKAEKIKLELYLKEIGGGGDERKEKCG